MLLKYFQNYFKVFRLESRSRKIFRSILDLLRILYISLYYSRTILILFSFERYVRAMIYSRYTCICLDMRFIFVIIHLFLLLYNRVFVLRLYWFPEDNISCGLIKFTDINYICITWLRKIQSKHIHIYKQKYVIYVKLTLYITFYFITFTLHNIFF